MSEPAVAVDRLVVHHGTTVAVDGLSFTAERGEVLAVLGPNGAGKTSTIEVLEGYAAPTGGRVRVLGLDPSVDGRRLAGRIGVMLQDGGVHPGIRPPEILRLFAALYPDPLDPIELLDRVGLRDRTDVTWRSLSGGEQQRLSLALAVIGRPEVAFLDEPTAGVDVRGRQVIRSLIAELAADGCAVIVCTHELDEAEKIADRVVIIDRGRVVGSGTMAELRGGDGTEIRFSVDGALDDAALDALAREVGTDIEVVGDGEYRLAVRDAEAKGATTAAVARWLADHDIALGDLRAGRQRLEDVFLALTDTGDPGDPAGDRDGDRRPRSRRSRR